MRLSYSCFRDMEEARSILKDCGELATQATSTIPRSMKLATTEKVEGGEGTVKSEGKDSSDSSGSKTGQDHMSSGNAAVVRDLHDLLLFLLLLLSSLFRGATLMKHGNWWRDRTLNCVV